MTTYEGAILLQLDKAKLVLQALEMLSKETPYTFADIRSELSAAINKLEKEEEETDDLPY